MTGSNPPHTMRRRDFLQAGTALTASAMFMGLGPSRAFGADADGSTKVDIPTTTLNNGLEMPMLGFGTFTLKGEVGERCVADAISVGYRLIDTAAVYDNEEAVGAGIKKSGIKREELFVTSKLWVSGMGYEKAKRAFQQTLDKLGTDYLDLYLIHRPRPYGQVQGSWKAMEELHKEGRIKAIGLSNFDGKQLDELTAKGTVKPVINQIENHAFFQQEDYAEVLKKAEVQHQGWSPFAQGRNNLFTNETLVAIGKKHNKTAAQVSLRWHIQRGIVAIPRSSQKAHMIENLSIFDFKLSDAEMKQIAELDLNKTQFPEWG